MSKFKNIGNIKSDLYLFTLLKNDKNIEDLLEALDNGDIEITADNKFDYKNPDILNKVKLTDSNKIIRPIALDYDIEFISSPNQLPIFHLTIYNADNYINSYETLEDDGYKYFYVVWFINDTVFFASNLHTNGRYQETSDIVTKNELWFTFSIPNIFYNNEEFILKLKANEKNIKPTLEPFFNFSISEDITANSNDRDSEVIFKTGFKYKDIKNNDVLIRSKDKQKELECLLQIIDSFRKPIEKRIIYKDLGDLYILPIDILARDKGDITNVLNLLSICNMLSHSGKYYVSNGKVIPKTNYKYRVLHEHLDSDIIDKKYINTTRKTPNSITHGLYIECFLNGNNYVTTGHIVKFLNSSDYYRVINTNIKFSTFESKFIYYVKLEKI